jgi:hypothetical protein
MPHARTYTHHSKTESDAKRIASPAERAKRLRKLAALTETEYAQLLRTVRTIVPAQYCDPYDALHQGLLLAFQKFEGWGELGAFVSRCAFLYALQQAQKRHRSVTFSQLQEHVDEDEDVDSLLPALEDPRYIEAVDERFIERIEEILAGSYNRRFPSTSHPAIHNATQVLGLFRENANLGRGVGIDEYEETPPAMVHRPRKPTHNTKVVRGLILDHLRDELQISRDHASSALKALRVSTRQALHEGWLPC